MFLDLCFAFVGLLFLGLVVVMPIVALVKAWRVGELVDRVARLEDEVAALRKTLRAQPAEAQEHVVAPPQPTWAEKEERAELPREEAPAVSTAESASLEAWLGQHALGWVAVVLLFFATGFFLKYAFDNQWIGELGRVSLGIVAGTALCAAGLWTHLQQRRLGSQMLTAAGLVLLYLSTFSTFGFYHLIPQDRAVVYLVLLVAASAALAILYEAESIAVMAVLGGLVTPLLMHSDIDQYINLFTYLALLNAGVVAIALFRDWKVVPMLGFAGTHLLFWLWYADRYHPEKMSAALIFHGVLYALYLAQAILAPLLRHRLANLAHLILLVVNPLAFAGAGYVLLHEDFYPWLAPMAVGMAIVYTLLTLPVLHRATVDVRLAASLVATGLSFLAIAVGLRAEAGWVSLGWAVEGLALWWFGYRVRNPLLRIMATVLLVAAAGRLVFVDTPWGGREFFLLVLNRYCLAGLAVAGCLVAAGAVARRLWPDAPRPERLAGWLMGLGGVVLIWMVLSVDIYQFFTQGDYDARRLGQMSLSVLWAIYAAAVLGAGFRLNSAPLRGMALGLFGLTLGKVVLVDMAGLPGIYRVAAFFVLSLMMGAGAWAYQRMGGPVHGRPLKGVRS